MREALRTRLYDRASFMSHLFCLIHSVRQRRRQGEPTARPKRAEPLLPPHPADRVTRLDRRHGLTAAFDARCLSRFLTLAPAVARATWRPAAPTPCARSRGWRTRAACRGPKEGGRVRACMHARLSRRRERRRRERRAQGLSHAFKRVHSNYYIVKYHLRSGRFPCQ